MTTQNNQSTTPRSYACTGKQHADIVAFAKARGWENKRFDFVVEEYKRSQLH